MYPLFWKIHFIFQYFILTRKIFEGFKEKISQHLCMFTSCINMHQSDQCSSAVLMSGIHIKVVSGSLELEQY